MGNEKGAANLTQASARGVLWVSAGRYLSQALQVLTTVVLARLLFPSDFGLVSMATIVTGLLTMVNELGLAEAIIQRKNLEERHLSTTFWMNIASSGVLTLVTVAVAPLASRFFNEPALQPILRIMAIGFVLGSLGSVQRALLSKRMDFKFVTIGRVGRIVVEQATAIALVLAGFGVWALVLGSLMGSLAESCLMWVFCSWRPRSIFDGQAIRELLSFSVNLLGARIIGYFGDNVTNLLVGKFLGGATAMGLFTIASNIPKIPRRQIASAITEVAFPAFSTVQQDNEKLRQGYAKIIKYISIISFPVLVGLLVMGLEFVRVVYGNNWIGAVVPMQIICVGAAISTLGIANGPVQKAKNRADVHFKLMVIAAVISVVFALVGVRYGLLGIAIAWSVRRIVFIWISAVATGSLIKMPFRAYLAAIYPAGLGSGMMGLVVAFYRDAAIRVFHFGEISVLISSTLLGIVVYWLLLLLLKERALIELIGIIWGIVKPLVRGVQKQGVYLRTFHL